MFGVVGYRDRLSEAVDAVEGFGFDFGVGSDEPTFGVVRFKAVDLAVGFGLDDLRLGFFASELTGPLESGSA
jgi:hypothetical protein